jgi:hypothetical protein
VKTVIRTYFVSTVTNTLVHKTRVCGCVCANPCYAGSSGALALGSHDSNVLLLTAESVVSVNRIRSAQSSMRTRK